MGGGSRQASGLGNEWFSWLEKGQTGEEVCKKEVERVEVDCEKLGFVTTQGRNRERKQTKKKDRSRYFRAAVLYYSYIYHHT